MNIIGLWHEPMYRETVFVVVLFLTAISVPLFFLRKRSQKFTGAWASVQSWFIVAPLVLLFLGLATPWPLVFITCIGIYGAKTYFRMVGIYHRTWFVWLTYFFIIFLGYACYQPELLMTYYDLTPMIFIGTVFLVPLARNSAKHMIQYIALTALGFIFMGWCFMHLGRILHFQKGIYILMYIFILTEFAESCGTAVTKAFGRIRLCDKITSRFTLEGFLVSLVLTVLLAWGMRHLLPDRSEKFWIAAGLIAVVFGRIGDLTVSVIRKDLGIKATGPFIIGRDDILARMDKLIFISPIFYYCFQYLERAPF